MNAGIIASRYAEALLKFVQETRNGDKVYSQACVLVLRMDELTQLKSYICDQEGAGLEKKQELIETALGESMTSEMKRFLTLVAYKRRMPYFYRMLHSFIYRYRRQQGISVGSFITALPAEGLKERLEEVFSERLGTDIRLEMKVNPEIIGGFIFELEDLRLDASVESQFRTIRKRLIEKNNRIV